MHPTLGPDGPAVSRLGLGCMSMTGYYGPTDPHEAAATLLEALDSGVTVFDTGDFYDDGANEELLGRTLAPPRPAPHRDRDPPSPTPRPREPDTATTASPPTWAGRHRALRTAVTHCPRRAQSSPRGTRLSVTSLTLRILRRGAGT